MPRVEDYLPRGVDVGDVDPLPADVEGYEPSEAGDPEEGESPDPAAGVGDDDMEVDASLLEPTFESLEALPLVVAEDFADKVHFKVSVFSSVEDDGWTSLKMRDRVSYLQKPSFVRDDTTNASLDVNKANDGTKKEIRALDALRVSATSACCPHAGFRFPRRMVRLRKTSSEPEQSPETMRPEARPLPSGV